MNTAVLAKIQLWFLAAVSLLLIFLAPSVWNYTPDGGIYVGTAQSLAENGRYWFNSQPNLLYYPGFSSVLSLFIRAFGLNFHVLHLFCAGIVVICLWLARAYFSWNRYGMVGLAVPVAMIAASEFNLQAFTILSDAMFVALVLSALLLWRKYAGAPSSKTLLACGIVVASAPLVRIEGLLLCAAFGMALSYEAYRTKRFDLPTFFKLALIGIAIVAPFAFWTWRNWTLYTPDTFNMANQFFFGLKGLNLYAQEIDPSSAARPVWLFAVLRVQLFVANLADMLLGFRIVEALPIQVWFISLIALCGAGSLRWFKLATHMERIFVVLSLVFLLLWTLKGGRSSYVVPRYWLLVLPFALVMIGCGIAELRDRLKAAPARHAASAAAIALFALVLANGVERITEFAGDGVYYENATEVIQRTADYVSERIPPETSLATTDWGVMPFALKRRSYQILNDTSHRLTLRRMNKYKTGYLVILGKRLVFPPIAREMVSRFPGIFKLEFEARPNGWGPVASVYAIDLAALTMALDDIAEGEALY